jgi:transcriptional regulator with XRE-family HTH domain
MVRQLREGKGMSLRRLAAAAKVDSTWLSRVEHGIHLNPDPKALHRLAQILDVETLELFQAANYSDGLPSFAPYLRSKYDLPPEAIDQLNAHFELLAQKYEVGEVASHDKHHSKGP